MKAKPPISTTMMTLPVLAVRRLGVIAVIWDDPNCGITLPSQSNAPAIPDFQQPTLILGGCKCYACAAAATAAAAAAATAATAAAAQAYR